MNRNQLTDWLHCLEGGMYDWVIDEIRKELAKPANEFYPDWDMMKPFHDRIAELEQQLAKPEQAPVAWIGDANYVEGQFVEGRVRRVWWECNTGVGQPLYTAPPQTEKQEPVAYVTGYHNGRCVITPLNPALLMPSGIALYIAPPKHKWVGLTDDECIKLINEIRIYSGDYELLIARTIEAKLKEKNT